MNKIWITFRTDWIDNYTDEGYNTERKQIVIDGEVMSEENFTTELKNIYPEISDQDLSEAIYYAQSCEHKSVKDAYLDSVYDRME